MAVLETASVAIEPTSQNELGYHHSVASLSHSASVRVPCPVHLIIILCISSADRIRTCEWWAENPLTQTTCRRHHVLWVVFKLITFVVSIQRTNQLLHNLKIMDIRNLLLGKELSVCLLRTRTFHRQTATRWQHHAVILFRFTLQTFLCTPLQVCLPSKRCTDTRNNIRFWQDLNKLGRIFYATTRIYKKLKFFIFSYSYIIHQNF